MPPGGGIAPLVWAARQCRSPKEDEMQRREERGASQRGHQPGDQRHTKDGLQSPRPAHRRTVRVTQNKHRPV